MKQTSIIRGEFDASKLKFLRELNGDTLKEVGKGIGKTDSFVSQMEHEIIKPNFEVIQKLSNFFKVNHVFFLNNSKIPQTTSAVFYRKQAAVPKRNWLQVEKKNQLFAFFEKKISKKLELSHFSLPNYAVKQENFKFIEFEKIDEITSSIRKQFKLGNGPISNMTLLAEKLGIRVNFSDISAENIDAATSKIDKSYYIIINNNRTSSVRIRYNLAHEMGHIYLHSLYSDKILGNSSYHKRIEAEANYFASSLLMPMNGLAIDMARTNMKFLMDLKKHWKVSIQALIYRGHDIGIITDQQALFLRQTIAREGWRKKEPFDDIIEIEYPSFIKSAIIYSKINSKEMIERFSDDSGFSEDDILKILGFDLFVQKETKIPKLKLL